MKELLAQVGHSYFWKKYVSRKPADAESVLFKKQKIYQELGLVCLWAMRQDLLLYTHFKALNLCDSAGVSEDGIILLMTHCAVLVSLDMPPDLGRLHKRQTRLLERADGNLRLLGRPFLADSLYFAVKAAIDYHPESLEEARRALGLLDKNGTVSFLQEVSNCAAQVFEFTGRFQELDAMAKDVVTKGSMYHNSQLIAMGKLYQGIAAYLQGETKRSLEILRPLLDELVRANDGVNAQTARLFIFKALCRQRRLRDAIPIAEECIEIIRKQHQTHQMVIARIYPFYLEELILSYGEQKDFFVVNRQIVSRINQLYAKCRSLVRAYDCHRGTFYRLEMLHAWHIRKRPAEALRSYERGIAYFDGEPGTLFAGTAPFSIRALSLRKEPQQAAGRLEKAFLELDKCGALYEMRQIERMLKALRKESAGRGRFIGFRSRPATPPPARSPTRSPYRAS